MSEVTQTDLDLEDPGVRGALRELLEQLEAMSIEYGTEVEDAVERVAATPLDEDRARRLYTRVLELLRSGEGSDGPSLAKEIDAEVERLVRSVERPASASVVGDNGEDGIELVARQGLEPREVRPVPEFLGNPVPLREGFVDVLALPLWDNNHRVELHVAEFRERNGRNPDQMELLGILTGMVHLPSLGAKKDPFKIEPLARSIARKGVERPPILTHEGVPKDGNRRIAAAKYVLESKQFTAEEKERARWVRVWKAPEGTTEDQFEAIVVALNFEEEHKEPWPEYVKARLVEETYQRMREATSGRFTESKNREIKREVGKQYAIETNDVTRYLKMVRWADDFETYHMDEAGRDPAEVRYKANDIFQWFYEIDAGRSGEKLTNKIDNDDELKAIVYDLMFDVIDSGAIVRSLYKVVADDQTTGLLVSAHEQADENPDGALDLVKTAVDEAKRKHKKQVGFSHYLKMLRTAIDKLGSTAPNRWKEFDTKLLRELKRVFAVALTAIDGELARREAEETP